MNSVNQSSSAVSIQKTVLPYDTDGEVQLKLANQIMSCLMMEENPESLMLSMNGERLISSGTINVIFGKTGTGKSSLTHAIVAALLHKNKYLPELMLKNEFKDDIIVLWLDTELFKNEFVRARNKMIRMAERNIDDYCLLPMRMQSILTSNRLDSLTEAVKWLTASCKEKHLVIVTDTVTDLIGNFNDVEQTEGITQHLLNIVEEYNCTFVCVMHETNNKAIGHLGSSLERKSSSTINIKRTKSSIRLENTKNRNGKETPSVQVEFGDGPYLRLVNSVDQLTNLAEGGKRGRPEKVSYAELDSVLSNEMISRSGKINGLIRALARKYNCSEQTIRNRIKVIQHQSN